MKPEDFAKSGKEYGHQVAFFQRASLELKRYPELKWLYSNTNEEKTNSAIVGMRAKASGRKKGVSDICGPFKRKQYSGIYIELKKLKQSGVGPSKEQLEFGEFVEKQGFFFTVAYGWEEAWNYLEWYLSL
jgi:hypothetical protein